MAASSSLVVVSCFLVMVSAESVGSRVGEGSMWGIFAQRGLILSLTLPASCLSLCNWTLLLWLHLRCFVDNLLNSRFNLWRAEFEGVDENVLVDHGLDLRYTTLLALSPMTLNSSSHRICNRLCSNRRWVSMKLASWRLFGHCTPLFPLF